MAYTYEQVCVQLYFQENWTALMAATRNGRYAVVDLLLRHGADPDMQDEVSKPLQSTPLFSSRMITW